MKPRTYKINRSFHFASTARIRLFNDFVDPCLASPHASQPWSNYVPFSSSLAIAPTSFPFAFTSLRHI